MLGVLVAFAAARLVRHIVALRAKDPFGKLLAAGVTTLIAGQAAINFGGMLGVLPLTGVPVPLISYGGTSLITTLAGDRPRAVGRHARRAGAACRRAARARARSRPAAPQAAAGHRRQRARPPAAAARARRRRAM